MEKVKVSLNKAKYFMKSLSISGMTEMDGRLYITIGDADSVVNSFGSLLISRKFNDNSIASITYKFIDVKKEDEKTISTEIPTTRNDLSIELIDYDYTSATTEYYIDFNDVHKIYESDLEAVKINPCLNDYSVRFFDAEDKDVTLVNYSVQNQNKLSVNCDYETYLTFPQNTSHIEFGQNEFYGVDFEGNCYLWSEYTDDSTVELLLDESAVNIQIGLSNNVDYAHLLQESAFNKLYESRYKDNIIPDIIDMEKIRFVPFVEKNGTYTDIDNLRFKFFFRTRDLDNDWKVLSEAEQVEQGTELKDIKVWNQYAIESAITYNNVFVQERESDYLDWLNFTNEDVFYQKMKLKKSFIRLSFYDSDDVLSQKLMFYSTIFFDTNKMYDEYIHGERVSPEIGYTGRITSEISVTNNFDRTKSSEGFYLYVFKADAPLENEEKTIYMKVEFNHAKYGRILPMAALTFKDGKATEIMPSNYKDNIYIPIKLRYINYNGEWVYAYTIEDNQERTIKSNDHDLIYFLFEPKLRVENS